jgi:hypothetical protein
MAYVSGWPSPLIFVEFQKHLIQYVKPLNSNKICMIIDNHNSHCSAEATLAKENGIVLLTISAHTSHVLQPLNWLDFRSCKTYYNVYCKDWIHTLALL